MSSYSSKRSETSDSSKNYSTMDAETLRLKAQRLQRQKLKALADVAKIQYIITELECTIADCELQREIALKGTEKSYNSSKKRRRSQSVERRSKERKHGSGQSMGSSKSTHSSGQHKQTEAQTSPALELLKTVPGKEAGKPVTIVNKSEDKTDKKHTQKHKAMHSEKTRQRKSKKSVEILHTPSIDSKQVIQVKKFEVKSPCNLHGHAHCICNTLQEHTTNQSNILNNMELTQFDNAGLAVHMRPLDDPNEPFNQTQSPLNVMCHIPVQIVGRPSYRTALRQPVRGLMNESQMPCRETHLTMINNTLFKELREQKPLPRKPDVHSLSSAATMILMNDSLTYRQVLND